MAEAGAPPSSCSPSRLHRLTAFVLRSYAKASQYIYINQEDVNNTILWVKQRQQDNGCFELLGALFNKGMRVSWTIREE